MTSGNRVAARRAFIVLLHVVAGTLVIASGWVNAANWGVEDLMRSLGQVRSAKARFVERKHLAILNEPLELSGTLIYTAPGRLEKHTLSPNPESLVLQQDTLTIDSKAAGKRRTLALSDYPVVWAFVESIRSTLAGDLQTLRRFYQVTLEGDEGAWLLLLKPIERKMRGVVSEIRIGGRANWINTIEILETEGDRSVMTINRDTS
jgi:outer membrane lipoprotein-sorting protein